MEGKSSEMGITNINKSLEEKIKECGAKFESLPTSAEELLPLLDEAEALLASVGQSPPPSTSMMSALKPLIAVLAAKGMLAHADADVRVAVAACISEVTRITSPYVPYNDDVMKEFFKEVVNSFAELDDLKSRSFPKRVSILETLARVRSCVLMLDLECNELILEMFRHFLNSISLKHQEDIFSSVETIMSIMINDSDEISKELISCLLQSVRKYNMERLSVSFMLGEKVIRNCAYKLKPLLKELVGEQHNEYSKFVVALCQQASDAMEQSYIEASAKNAPEESKKDSDKVVEQDPGAQGPEETRGQQRVERPSRVIKKSAKAKEAERMLRTNKTNKMKACPVKKAESLGKKEEEAEPKPGEPDPSTVAPESGSRLKIGCARSRKKAANSQKDIIEGTSDLKGNPLRQYVSKGASASADTKKVGPKNKKKEKKGSECKKNKEEAAPAYSDKNDNQDIHRKDIIAGKDNANKLVKKKTNLGESSGSKRKRGTEKEKEDEEAKKEHKEFGGKKQRYDESLIGEKIKVWWPNDKAFYNGTVENYNRSDKRHTVFYDDGDIEVLNLKEEVWEFLEG